ncbi:hypothetical protein X801_10389, partial [Opisthorchis viverrini]
LYCRRTRISAIIVKDSLSRRSGAQKTTQVLSEILPIQPMLSFRDLTGGDILDAGRVARGTKLATPTDWWDEDTEDNTLRPLKVVLRKVHLALNVSCAVNQIRLGVSNVQATAYLRCSFETKGETGCVNSHLNLERKKRTP